MTSTRPWYQIRWQFWLTLLVAMVICAFIYHQVNRLPEISVSSGPTGQTKTLKERMIFVVDLEKSFHKRGWPASIGLEGVDGKTIKVYWEEIKLPFVKQLIKSRK